MNYYLFVSLLSATMMCMICISEGLLCYTCSYTSDSPDDSCVLKPKSQTNCTKKYCTIVRQEYVNPPGKVVTFQRNCEDRPQFLNSQHKDSTFKTYYRSCTSDLCNNSDGKKSATNIDPNLGAAENMIIKGKPWT